VDPRPVPIAAHLRRQPVQGGIERRETINGGRLGSHHGALFGEEGQLDPLGHRRPARVVLATDLDGDPFDPFVEALQPAELVLDVIAELVRDFALLTADRDVHLVPPRKSGWVASTSLRPPGVWSRRGDAGHDFTSARGPFDRGVERHPTGRPGLRPHIRLLRRSRRCDERVGPLLAFSRHTTHLMS
jgi:hypothetical protein